MRTALVPLLTLACLVAGDDLARAGDAAGLAGSETCAVCHEAQAASFFASSMGNAHDPRSPAAKLGCETCHGPGQAHADREGAPGPNDVMRFTPETVTPVTERNAVCLDCHASGKRTLWQGSKHQARGLACTNCHSVHGGNAKSLARASESETCTQCHKDIKAQLQRPSHHPVREGKLECTNCHNPHGTVADKLVAANSTNEKCFECHTEKRGPFLWEHAPVTEDCLTCHTPHGSTHDKLLQAKRPFLCQRCHSNSRHPGTLYALRVGQEGQSVYTVQNNREYNRACSNCHSQTHGSNHPSGEKLAR